MPTVKAFIRTTSNKKDVNIRFRYSDGRNIQLFHKSEIVIPPSVFDEKKECIKAKVVFDASKRTQIDNAITERTKLIRELCDGVVTPDKTIFNSEWLEQSIDKCLHPDKYVTSHAAISFFDIFNEFLEKHELSEVRKGSFRVIMRALQRYELYTQTKGKKDFVLSLDTVTPDMLRDITTFLTKEHETCKEYPEMYKQFPEHREPKQRGQNTINDVLKKMRTFFRWAVNNKKTTNNPFPGYTIKECSYGTPYYISIEERNTLHNTDLSHRPSLEIQRDIFVFQCLIGCRVSDLYRLTKKSIIDGEVQYIAQKTKDEKPRTVKVPLNTISRAILDKYADFEGEALFPYISEQKYNTSIKEMFTAAGLTRPVVILDPLTRKSVIRPLNEIASSHLARRTFIGNLYKKVKDPNLISEVSGHAEDSKAFSRYRNIDKEDKIELVKMLE